MGQYHIPHNITRREYFHAHRVNNELKNVEQVGWPQSSSTALWALLSNSNGRGGGDFNDHEIIGRWAGDAIAIQGDYCEPTDRGHISDGYGTDADLAGWTDISPLVADFLQKFTD